MTNVGIYDIGPVDSDPYVPIVPSTIYNSSEGTSIGPNFNSLFDGSQLLICNRFSLLHEWFWFGNDGLAFLSM